MMNYRPYANRKRPAKQELPPEVRCSAEQLWAAAVAAQRFNGEYIKYNVDPYGNEVTSKYANKLLVRYLLGFPSNGIRWHEDVANLVITDEDRALGQEMRDYFRGYMFRVLTNTANAFQQSVLSVVDCDEFTNCDAMAVGIVRCLPATYYREHEAMRRQGLAATAPKPRVGARLRSIEITVIDCRFSEKWGRYFVNAVGTDNNIYRIASDQHWPADARYSITGTVRNITDDGGIQLNRVIWHHRLGMEEQA